MDYSGFTTDLPNGLTVSVQWHDRNYAERNANGDVISVEIGCWVTADREELMTCRVWREAHRDWFWSDDVIGRVPVADVVKFIDEAQKYSADLVEAHQIVF